MINRKNEFHSAIAELKKSISESTKIIDAMEGTNIFRVPVQALTLTLQILHIKKPTQ